MSNSSLQKIVLENKGSRPAIGVEVTLARGFVTPNIRASGFGVSSDPNIALSPDRDSIKIEWPGAVVTANGRIRIECEPNSNEFEVGAIRWDYAPAESASEFTEDKLLKVLEMPPAWLEKPSTRRTSDDSCARTMQKFFCNMELNSLPELYRLEIGGGGITEAESYARAYANDVARAAFDRQLTERLAGHMSPAEIDPRVSRYFSLLLKKIILTYFPAYKADGSGSTDLIELAFELFSAGELELPFGANDVSEVTPDGMPYFFFAEFGFAACQDRNERAFWEPLMNVLVRTQELYLAAYMNRMPGRKKRGRYDSQRRSIMDPRDVVRLRSKYAGKSLADLSECMTQNVKYALQDEVAPG